jgi:hypothetical protein
MFLAAAGQIGLSANGTPVFRSTDTQAVLDVNLQVSGTARRITGDFSNATIANRVLFQTSTTNGNTSVHAIPNGTSTESSFRAFNNSDPTNASLGGVICNATDVIVQSGATGTGTFLPMTFYTNGSERVRVDTSGNVGVGTSSPTQLLDVNGNVAITGSARRITGDFSNATVASRVMFQTSTTNANSNVGTIPNGTATGSAWNAFNASDPTNSGVFQLLALSADMRMNANAVGTGTYLPMTFYTGGSERVRVDTSGNVGIGTNAPAHTLDVNVASASFRVRNATGGNDFTVKSVAGPITQIGSVANTPLEILTNDLARVHIDSSGNVGIGTSSPGDKLVVAASSGAVYAAFNNGTVNTVFGVAAGNVGLLGTTTNQDLLFFANNAERARITAAGLLQFNSGYGSVATAFGCRAWINFDGTSGSIGTGRGSGNVSSVTDNGTGDYTINFTNAMPDTNYAVVGTVKEYDSTAGTTLLFYLATQTLANTISTSFVRVKSGTATGTPIDAVAVCVAIFR